MDTEIKPVQVKFRHGIAMFVVLGAIILVTLFGYVGLTLAGKDQTLSGDLNDIKSRDEAAYSGLQIAINRFVSQPDTMLKVFNSFIQEGRTTKTKPTKTWIDLASTSLNLVSSEPGWFSLASGEDQTAVKVRLLGIARTRDTVGSPVGNMDNDSIYVSLLCMARGRHGDEKTIQATYQVHGLTGAINKSVRTYVIPSYAFYMGSTLQSTNMGMTITGDMYVSGTANSFLNAGAFITANGIVKWNGDLHSDAPLTFLDKVYVSGNLYVNSKGRIQFQEHAVIAGGFLTTDDSIYAKKNLLVLGTGSTSAWNSDKTLRVDGDYVYVQSGEKSKFSSKIVVKGNAWLGTGAQGIDVADSFYVGGNLFLGDGGTTTSTINFNVSNATPLKIGKSIVQYNSGVISSNKPLVVGDSILTKGSVSVGTTYSSGYSWIQGNGIGAQPASSHWVNPPTPVSLGFDAVMQNTTLAKNPMDSILVDMVHSPEVKSGMIELNSALLLSAGISNPNITAANLNTLYSHLSSSNRLVNGYMVLRVGDSSGIGNSFSDDAYGFSGKMLLVVETKFDVNSNWPHSHDINSIQVLVIKSNGQLKTWGWQQGNFSGYFYWENPPCESMQASMPNGSTWWGGFIYGQHMPACSGSQFTFNTSNRINIIRSDIVIDDIGTNLPGIFQPAVGVGIPTRTTRSAVVNTMSPLLRLVHNRPAFQPIGVFR